MTLDEQQANLLGVSWAALLAETGERAPAGLDPGLAMVALCLVHDLPAPEPDPHFSARLRSLLHQAEAQLASVEADTECRRVSAVPDTEPRTES